MNAAWPPMKDGCRVLMKPASISIRLDTSSRVGTTASCDAGKHGSGRERLREGSRNV